MERERAVYGPEHATHEKGLMHGSDECSEIKGINDKNDAPLSTAVASNRFNVQMYLKTTPTIKCNGHF